jgi:hypothetical protein
MLEYTLSPHAAPDEMSVNLESEPCPEPMRFLFAELDALMIPLCICKLSPAKPKIKKAFTPLKSKGD